MTEQGNDFSGLVNYNLIKFRKLSRIVIIAITLYPYDRRKWQPTPVF